MPVFDLPAGPTRLRIKNDSTSKVVEEVRVRTAPPGGAEAQHTQPVLIPSEAEMVFEGPPPLPAQYYCVRLGWTVDGSGWAANECCCDSEQLNGPIDEIIVTLHEADPFISMEVYPEGGEPFDCACVGGAP